MTTPPNYRTNICNNFFIGCGYSKCGFAHNINELLPKKCGYDGRCINKKCNFYHTGEPLNKNNLWETLLKCHLQYTYENDKLEIIKNTIKGFDPKTIDDINKVLNGENIKSFVVHIDDDIESQNNLKEISIIKSDNIFIEMKKLEEKINNLTIDNCNYTDTHRYGLDIVCDKDKYLLITNFIKSLNVEYSLGFISK